MKQKIKLFKFCFLSIAFGTCVCIFSFSATEFKADTPPLVGPVFLLMAISLTFFLTQLKLYKINKTPKLFTFRDIVICSILLFFINFNLYGTIPFNVSRSNSVLIVGYLAKNPSLPKTKDEIENFVKEEYFIKNRAIEKRLDEQISAGNIKLVNGKYILTSQGYLVVKVFGNIADLYNVSTNFAKL